jgi:uncharacterized membrane protein YiaA
MTIKGYFFTILIIIALGIMWRLFVQINAVDETSTTNLLSNPKY